MGYADFIVDLPIRHQVVLVLVQFSTVLAANAVPHKIIVEMVGVDMGSNHYLITGANSRPMALTSWCLRSSSPEMDCTK